MTRKTHRLVLGSDDGGIAACGRQVWAARGDKFSTDRPAATCKMCEMKGQPMTELEKFCERLHSVPLKTAADARRNFDVDIEEYRRRAMAAAEMLETVRQGVRNNDCPYCQEVERTINQLAAKANKEPR